MGACLVSLKMNGQTLKKIKNTSTYKQKCSFVRFFLSGATECEIDKQGRFLITSNLREYATLEKDAIIIGVGTRIEIWNREKWKSYNSDENISADEIAEYDNVRYINCKSLYKSNKRQIIEIQRKN